MKRILAYVFALIFLAFALGSLPRSQNSGGSILFNSYWLLYVIYFIPIVLLGLLVVVTVIIAVNWRGLSEGIGSSMASSRRRKRGQRSILRLLIYMFFWGLAGVVYVLHRNSQGTGSQTNSDLTSQIIGEKASVPNLPLLNGSIVTISNFVRSDWFAIVFGALLVICGFVLVQSFRYSFKDANVTVLFPSNQVQALEAVGEALKIVDRHNTDPRSRIIACYEKLTVTASHLGAAITSDQTARELENNIRYTFKLHGGAIHGLTGLFEEARYSLHPITEYDVLQAVNYLHDVSKELNTALDKEP